jgi:hypothetical protein
VVCIEQAPWQKPSGPPSIAIEENLDMGNQAMAWIPDSVMQLPGIDAYFQEFDDEQGKLKSRLKASHQVVSDAMLHDIVTCLFPDSSFKFYNRASFLFIPIA